MLLYPMSFFSRMDPACRNRMVHSKISPPTTMLCSYPQLPTQQNYIYLGKLQYLTNVN